MKKYLTSVFLLLIIIACGGKKDKSTASNSMEGQKLYKQNCVLCHGDDGKLGLNGSKDLTKSTLTMDERIAMVTNGKGAMTGFGNLLSEEEIKQVAAYTFKLKDK